MYSEYKVIDGELCHRGMPKIEFRVCTNKQCVQYYLEIMANIKCNQ